jgi:hypothetical protein
MATSDRNAEIWSTRLQREILALESSDDDSKKMELLPPFIKTLGHTLNIEGGIAKIEFRIDVELDENAAAAEDAGKGGEDVTSNEDKSDAAATEETTNDNTEAETKEENAEKESSAPTDTAAAEQNESTKESSDSPAETITDPHVILVLDASMYWKSKDSSVEHSKSPQFYPFTKPLAVIKSGSHLFSGGSTIGNGDELDIDLDWTPR